MTNEFRILEHGNGQFSAERCVTKKPKPEWRKVTFDIVGIVGVVNKTTHFRTIEQVKDAIAETLRVERKQALAKVITRVVEIINGDEV